MHSDCCCRGKMPGSSWVCSMKTWPVECFARWVYARVIDGVFYEDMACWVFCQVNLRQHHHWCVLWRHGPSSVLPGESMPGSIVGVFNEDMTRQVFCQMCLCQDHCWCVLGRHGRSSVFPGESMPGSLLVCSMKTLPIKCFARWVCARIIVGVFYEDMAHQVFFQMSLCQNHCWCVLRRHGPSSILAGESVPGSSLMCSMKTWPVECFARWVCASIIVGVFYEDMAHQVFCQMGLFILQLLTGRVIACVLEFWWIVKTVVFG